MNAATRLPKHLTDGDYKEAAARLNCSVAAIKAIAEVESRSDGFLPDGHPVILFERHIMYRQVRDKLGQKKADELAAQYPDIINKTPGGYGTTASQPARMDRAAKLIDRECALQSASWGKFQIMGYHWHALGYATLQTFINAMYRDEAAHLFAFQRFIVINPGLHKALQRQDWPTVARLYNGPNYRLNAYDTRMAAAFAKHSKQEVA